MNVFHVFPVFPVLSSDETQTIAEALDVKYWLQNLEEYNTDAKKILVGAHACLVQE